MSSVTQRLWGGHCPSQRALRHTCSGIAEGWHPACTPARAERMPMRCDDADALCAPFLHCSFTPQPPTLQGRSHCAAHACAVRTSSRGRRPVSTWGTWGTCSYGLFQRACNETRWLYLNWQFFSTNTQGQQRMPRFPPPHTHKHAAEPQNRIWMQELHTDWRSTEWCRAHLECHSVWPCHDAWQCNRTPFG